MPLSQTRYTILAVVLLTAAVSVGESELPSDKPVPADTCIVDFTLPEGATVTVDGDDYGTKRVFTRKQSTQNKLHRATIVVRFPDRQTVEQQVWLFPGRRSRLAIAAPDRRRPDLVPQAGHSQSPDKTVFSEDGHLLLTAYRPTAILWDTATGRQLRTYSGHAEDICGIGIFPDQQRIMTASMDESAAIWELETGRQLSTFRVGSCFAASLSPDGSLIVTGGLDKVLSFYAITGRKRRTSAVIHKEHINGISFSPNGQRVVSDSDDQAIIWDTESGRALHMLAGHQYPVEGSQFSADNNRVVTLSRKSDEPNQNDAWGSEICLWDAHTGQKTASRHFRKESIWSFALLPDASGVIVPRVRQNAATGKGDIYLELYESNSLEYQREVAVNAAHLYCQFSPVGRFFDGEGLHDFKTGERVQTFGSRTASLNSIDFSSDGGPTMFWHPYLQLTNLHHSRPIRRIPDPSKESRYYSPQFLNDGRRILAEVGTEINGTTTTDLAILETETGSEMVRVPVATKGSILEMHSTRDGRLALLEIYFGAAGASVAALWDTVEKKLVHTFGGGHYNVHHSSISPDGHYVAVNPEKTNFTEYAPRREHHYLAAIHDAASGRLLRTLEWVTVESSSKTLISSSNVSSIMFSPDGATIATGGRVSFDNPQGDDPPNAGVVLLWDVRSGRMVSQFDVPFEVSGLRFSRTGEFLVAKSDDSTATVWHLPSQQRLCTIPHFHRSAPTVVPDEAKLLTIAHDKSIALWDLASGMRLCNYYRINSPIVNDEPVTPNEWLVISPEGVFDGSAVGREAVMFRIGPGLNVVPVDRFFKDLYYPGLLAAIWRGERPLPKTEIGRAEPPTIKIVSPTDGGAVDSVNAELVVEATDQGGGIQGPWLKHNGARVLASVKSERDGKSLRQTYQVRLVEGENKLEFQAASADGSWESEPVSITLNYSKPLEKPELYVLAIGLNEYQDSAMNLRFAAADAQAIGKLFQDRGSALYANVHVTELTNESATKVGIHDALKGIADKARPQDTLITFLAGHGTTIGQRYYFVPYEFQRQSGASMEEDIRRQGLAADVLADDITAVPARRRILVLDTCHSGGAVDFAHTGRDPFALRGALDRLNRASGIFSICAAPVGDEAKEVEELGHGVLTYSLLAGLRAVDSGPLADDYIKPGNPEQVADVFEWFSYASGHVPRLMEQYYGRQQDVQTSSSGNSFPVLPVTDN